MTVRSWTRALGGRELALLGIVVAVGAVFAATNATFLTTGNLENVAVQSSMLTLIALGMTVVILAGGIDLSVGSTAAVTGVVAAGLSASHGWSPVAASAAGILAGVAIGGVNGALVTLLRVPDFIATLGTLTALRGLAFVLAGGFAIRAEDPGLTWLARAEPAGVPLPILATLAVYAVLALVLSQTPAGRAFYAVGGGRATARLEGLRVGRTTCLAYMVCALLAAVAGLVLAARNAAGSPQAAAGWELQAVAIVILGGSNLFGGRGGVTGTLLAGLLIGMINNWLSLQGYESWLGNVVLGVLLVAVVALNERDRRRRARAAAMARLHGVSGQVREAAA
jgi:ribose/xylose/arabinose/galactoside ABC-type transport system permease subunit